eukprot:gene29119-35145_t
MESILFTQTEIDLTLSAAERIFQGRLKSGLFETTITPADWDGYLCKEIDTSDKFHQGVPRPSTIRKLCQANQSYIFGPFVPRAEPLESGKQFSRILSLKGKKDT